MDARRDPRWRASGASTPEEYEWWARRLCGVACLRMILAWHGLEPPPALDLARVMVGVGGYRHRADGGLDGLVYRPFVDHLAQSWGITAHVVAPLDLDGIGGALTRGAAVMASVSPAIRRPGVPPPSRGGHLVLVHGRVGGHLVLHNPSGDTPGAQRSAVVDDAHFSACFAGRGVVVDPPPAPSR